MIHSIFIINGSGDVVMEKHWKSVIPKAVCDYFFDAQNKASCVADIPPIITAPHHYLINVHRNKLHYVAVVTEEVPPLFVIEFLHRMADIVVSYFGSHSETVIKDNYVLLYEVFDEMLDNGYPLATESNILKELIRPPNVMRDLKDKVLGEAGSTVADQLPSNQVSNIPWRRTAVRYNHNEAYFDVVEEIDCIIDKSGSVVFAEIQGYIDCLIKLSGMPDLTLSFINPRLLDDLSFHPCVRFKRWESDRVLSFVPPDGNFRLISYHIAQGIQNLSIPVNIKHNIQFREGVGASRIELTICTKQSHGKGLENVRLEIPLPRAITSVSLTASEGKWSYETHSGANQKVVIWDIGKLEIGRNLNLKGTVSFGAQGIPTDSTPTIQVFFTLPQNTVSGVRVNRLDMYREKYKPFKGVKYITKAGRFQVRTS